MNDDFKIGDTVQVIEPGKFYYLLLGKVLNLSKELLIVEIKMLDDDSIHRYDFEEVKKITKKEYQVKRLTYSYD